MTDLLERRLRALDRLEVTRVGDNLVARTDFGRPRRVVLAGHTDTVPARGDPGPRREGDRLYGLGAADMKAGLAVQLALAESVVEPAVDLTFVFYAREEVAAVESGLGELVAARPDLLVGDVAVLGEPTAATIEAGCQGTMRLRVVLAGTRAHTARPWTGRNAVHRAGPLLCAIDQAPERRPVLQGCAFREALQVVRIEGGHAGNVVPDRVELTVNHRFAPDRSPADAEAHVRALLAPFLDDTDTVEVVDVAPGAMPALDHPIVRALVERNELEVRAKLGWTDVARFAALGVPAVNFGPGDPLVAHTAEEHVDLAHLERVHAALLDVVTSPPEG